MALTETWLNSDNASITELCPEGFKFTHAPRNYKKRGRSVLLNLIDIRIFVIYHPPPSPVDGLTVSLFFAQISQFLEHTVILPETLLILLQFIFPHWKWYYIVAKYAFSKLLTNKIKIYFWLWLFTTPCCDRTCMLKLSSKDISSCELHFRNLNQKENETM